MSAELHIILLNVAILFIAYFAIYPTYAGNDFKKISTQDFIASMVSLGIAGSVYFATGVEFTLFFFEVSWAWFTLVSFTIIELPLFYWYAKRHNVKLP
ncbi:hypothetical protein [Pseudoalteromonas luteoviolacea]|uniref:Uncharacterized protein n=1 Tax=Pseudoalteromonas luteoviolacea S4054 TaxID=1129367 RepID=A0A0F6AAJ9_9GAMM|nr:hypothetical protein [Pseudoalteromonas luteoviolacea]AOT09526.1 hypothetical protein S4054249_17580 [Pseudoalteromonas luteoviolacea]AOT14438.1 hypothetical protein S40542_17550 [Pseudoalteromonas luteoviolacea]AOT19354.1 hypothetical protein S4054_17555 [Pseudoalteromonas luteoviolacea]KKE83215.1 hypothetical protein N479_15335 [Pseudoalteromonas luteoviolacea S4054]KZN68844.1 hypothetical protein N481_23145 [Pseudoalteromonas luteoviolacea S4047-1]